MVVCLDYLEINSSFLLKIFSFFFLFWMLLNKCLLIIYAQSFIFYYCRTQILLCIFTFVFINRLYLYDHVAVKHVEIFWPYNGRLIKKNYLLCLKVIISTDQQLNANSFFCRAIIWQLVRKDVRFLNVCFRLSQR